MIICVCSARPDQPQFLNKWILKNLITLKVPTMVHKVEEVLTEFLSFEGHR
jgi:hypothetical protein